ncbi:MAG: hypothetical protein FWD19_06220 [Defluviitaleaceae bacterium]|nr:hypothetical protein [Defluviitaleaceae bacterium]
MIKKMQYISISGHIAGLNHAVNRYLSRYEIQLQHDAHTLMEPFTTLNPYAQTLRKAEKLSALTAPAPKIFVPVAPAEAVNIVEAAADAYENRASRLLELEQTIEFAQRDIETLENFSALEINLKKLEDCEFIYHCMGRLTTENFKKFEIFLQNDERIFFVITKREKDFSHGIFFTPTAHRDEISAILASLEIVPANVVSKNGTPAAIIHRLRTEIFDSQKEVDILTRETFSHICSQEKLAIACEKIKNLYASFDVKKFASISKNQRVFTFSGWIGADDADALEQEIESDDAIIFSRRVKNEKPPTALKNFPIIRQFEFFTRLYGLPEYDEIDPTPILAVTYTILFGLMFGDVGHGAVLAIVGILAQKRHSQLGKIMTIVGISAALFGVLYGSVFGFEFSPIWRRPTENIGETLIFAVILGSGLIALSMFLSMYNSFRQGKIIALLFGANGFAGLIFYSSAIFVASRVLKNFPITPLVIFVAIFPLAFVCLKLPLENFLRGEKIKFSDAIFAIFETLLSYATNTVSFVRVGAFAVSHAGMMHVVLQLGGVRENFFILFFGNALVIFIEGVLIGIQVLRLDFYEIFSRFYKGTGKEFLPLKKI